MDDHVLSQPFRWSRTFHWLQMCRAFRLALDLRKLLLLIIGIGLMDFGNYSAAILFPVERPHRDARVTTILTRYEDDFVCWNSGEFATNMTAAEVVRDFPVHPGDTLLQAASNWPIVLRPFREFVEPAAQLISHDHSLMGDLGAVFRLLWSIMLWSIFAGAVTRMAAVEFANDERSKVFAALRFSVTRFPAYMVALLVPVAVVLLLWLIGFVGGLIGRIGGIGEVAVALMYPVGMVLSLIMTLIVMGMAIGWPLIIAAVSTDDTDGFDAFSRAFSHIYNRPWNYLWNSVVALTYGSAVILFIGMFGTLVVHLTDLSVGSGTGSARMAGMKADAPVFRATDRAADNLASATDSAESSEGKAGAMAERIQSPPALTETGEDVATATEATEKNIDVAIETDAGVASENDEAVVSTIAVMFTTLWLRIWSGLIVAFVFSYFWSASTISFFLLRQSDDGAPLTTIANDDPDDDNS